MYIEKIKIDKFRVLEDIEIHFQPPGGATADPETGNVINIIAGVNGTGKTSVLEFIHTQKNHRNVEWFFPEFENKSDKISTLLKTQNKRIIYFPFSSLIKQYDKEVLDDIEKYMVQYIFNTERRIHEADPEKRSKESFKIFNNMFSPIFMDTVLYSISSNSLVMSAKPIFRGVKGSNLSIDDLSDGEKNVYIKILSLLSFNPINSVILVDEPELGLHPAWQQKIMQIYSRIGKNNQFIVATHSPQIIASVPYKNRILLRKENGKIQSVHMNQPPSGVDVNSILSEIMGADPRPPELLKLYAQYRKFVEERKENTPEALAVKAQLSEESDHSRFMQEMAFLIELRDVV